MKRYVLAAMLATSLITGLQPAVAGDYYRIGGGYPYSSEPCGPPPAQPVQQGRPILQKILIGGLLIGAGFAAGRLTAPRPNYGGYGGGHGGGHGGGYHAPHHAHHHGPSHGHFRGF